MVRPDFDAAQVRRNNLMAYLLPRLGRSKIFVVARLSDIKAAFSGIAITCERMLLDKHKTIRAHQITPVTLQRTSSCESYAETDSTGTRVQRTYGYGSMECHH